MKAKPLQVTDATFYGLVSLFFFLVHDHKSDFCNAFRRNPTSEWENTSGKVLDSFIGLCIILIDFMVSTKFMDFVAFLGQETHWSP